MTVVDQTRGLSHSLEYTAYLTLLKNPETQPKVKNRDANLFVQNLTESVEREEAKLMANEPILEKAADGTVLAQIRTLLNML